MFHGIRNLSKVGIVVVGSNSTTCKEFVSVLALLIFMDLLLLKLYLELVYFSEKLFGGKYHVGNVGDVD